MIIVSASSSFLALSFSQDAAQASPRVGIQRFKDIALAVLKVLKPSTQGSVQIFADSSHAAAIGAPGFVANAVFEFVHALVARPLHCPFKVVA